MSALRNSRGSVKACKKCGATDASFSKDRTRTDGLARWCKLCMATYRAAWITTKDAAARSKMRSDVKRWRESNPEQKRELDRKHRRTEHYKVKQNEYLKQWRPKNRAAVNAQHAYRRVRLINATPPWIDRAQIKAVYYKAEDLSQRYGVPFVVDHIIPIVSDTVCGLHCWHNLQILDEQLNLQKSNTYQTDW